MFPDLGVAGTSTAALASVCAMAFLRSSMDDSDSDMKIRSSTWMGGLEIWGIWFRGCERAGRRGRGRGQTDLDIGGSVLLGLAVATRLCKKKTHPLPLHMDPLMNAECVHLAPLPRTTHNLFSCIRRQRAAAMAASGRAMCLRTKRTGLFLLCSAATTMFWTVCERSWLQSDDSMCTDAAPIEYLPLRAVASESYRGEGGGRNIIGT
jgi:hypothetical protein